MEYQTKWSFAFRKLTVGWRTWRLTVRPSNSTAQGREDFLEEVTYKVRPEGQEGIQVKSLEKRVQVDLRGSW